MFCSNLRNKQYCFGNQQLAKEEYERRAQEWDLRSRKTYEGAKKAFREMLRTQSWHRATFVDQCQECSDSNYVYASKGCTNCFFVDELEDCMNVLRAFGGKDCLDSVCTAVGVELVYGSVTPQDKCYDVKFGYNIMQCKYMEYCAQCFQCQHCFGCCGLVKKQYHIFNKPYEPEEYKKKKTEVIAAMKKSGEYGKFFPAHFAANPYEESLSGFYWPLSKGEGEKRGFRMSAAEEEREASAQGASKISDRCDQADESVTKTPFWDATAKRPFQILKEDVAFAQDLGVPLPYTYYMHRLQENFRLISFNGELRTTACGKCRKQTQTSWPVEYDGRILCEECYLKEVY